MDRFKAEKIPLSVGVIDMDWHLVEEVDKKDGHGWTGKSRCAPTSLFHYFRLID